MSDQNGKVPSYYLHPGQLFASPEATLVKTVLGSCVAICLWDVQSGIGGLNHFLLPRWTGKQDKSSRFGNVALESLINRLEALGAKKPRLRAKIFGGASVIEAFRSAREPLGPKNIAMARKLLSDEGIVVAEEDVGGRACRKLLFNTANGVAVVTRL